MVPVLKKMIYAHCPSHLQSSVQGRSILLQLQRAPQFLLQEQRFNSLSAFDTSGVVIQIS